MFIVKRCESEFGETWAVTVGEFKTEEEAEAFREEEERLSNFHPWFEVEEV
jgi:hypothetical protein